VTGRNHLADTTSLHCHADRLEHGDARIAVRTTFVEARSPTLPAVSKPYIERFGREEPILVGGPGITAHDRACFPAGGCRELVVGIPVPLHGGGDLRAVIMSLTIQNFDHYERTRTLDSCSRASKHSRFERFDVDFHDVGFSLATYDVIVQSNCFDFNISPALFEPVDH
jgi:hypothetical protein